MLLHLMHYVFQTLVLIWLFCLQMMLMCLFICHLFLPLRQSQVVQVVQVHHPPTPSPGTQQFVNVTLTPPTTVSSNSSAPSTSTPTPSAGTQCVNVISKYLVQYVPVATRKDKSSSTRVTGSGILTSAEGLVLLKGKEEKKQKEEKDKRKK